MYGQYGGRHVVSYRDGLFGFDNVSTCVGHHKGSDQIVALGTSQKQGVPFFFDNEGRTIVLGNDIFKNSFLIAADAVVFRHKIEIGQIQVCDRHRLCGRYGIATLVCGHKRSFQDVLLRTVGGRQ